MAGSRDLKKVKSETNVPATQSPVLKKSLSAPPDTPLTDASSTSSAQTVAAETPAPTPAAEQGTWSYFKPWTWFTQPVVKENTGDRNSALISIIPSIPNLPESKTEASLAKEPTALPTMMVDVGTQTETETETIVPPAPISPVKKTASAPPSARRSPRPETPKITEYAGTLLASPKASPKSETPTASQEQADCTTVSTYVRSSP